MEKQDYIAKEVAAKEQVMHLDVNNKSTLRSMLSKEFDQNERSTQDYIRGYDDDQPLTNSDYNHFEE